jgi:hypothetical protein
MSHLREDELLFHYYGESDAPASAEAHLAVCAACRAELRALTRVLEAVDEAPIPERADDYGAEVWRVIAARVNGLHQASTNDGPLFGRPFWKPSRNWLWFHSDRSLWSGSGGSIRWLAPQAALAAAVVVLLTWTFAPVRHGDVARDRSRVAATGLGPGASASRASASQHDRSLRGDPGAATPGDAAPGDATPGDATPGDVTPGDPTPGDPTPGDPTPGDPTPGDTVLRAAVEEHLERTEIMLSEINNADDTDLSLVREWANELASANRLYRQSATLSGETDVERVLDDLERVLLEVAHAGGEPDGATLQDLRGRLDTRGTAFKVRLASAGLRERGL